MPPLMRKMRIHIKICWIRAMRRERSICGSTENCGIGLPGKWRGENSGSAFQGCKIPAPVVYYEHLARFFTSLVRVIPVCLARSSTSLADMVYYENSVAASRGPNPAGRTRGLPITERQNDIV